MEGDNKMDYLTQQLIKAREVRGLSANQLANKIGINVETILNIETGEKKPELFVIEKISEALNYQFQIGNVKI